MRFWAGLALGLVLGASGTWLALERPWRGEPAPLAEQAADAGPATTASGKPSKRKRRAGRRGAAGDGEAPPPELSAADRQIVSRGPAISLPSRTIDLSASDDARPLAADEINQVIRRSSEPILACIEGARVGAELKSQVKLSMLVGGDGRVSKVRVTAPRWFIEHGLAECAGKAVRAWRFPPTGAATVVDAPYHID